MYKRFTDRARKVMQLANQEAVHFSHEYIGTEHILLALVAEGSGVAANVLKNLNVDPGKIRREIELIVCCGPEVLHTGKLPQTPRAKKVIEYAVEEARKLNHNYVGTEHLLLGLIREEEGVAAQVLMNLGLSLEVLRAEVMNLLGVAPDQAAAKSSSESPVETTPSAPLPPRIAFALRDFDSLIELLNELKMDAFAGQDFHRAAMLRDQSVALKKMKEWLLRECQREPKNGSSPESRQEPSPVSFTEYDLYVPVQNEKGERIDETKLDQLRSRLAEEFKAVVPVNAGTMMKTEAGPVAADMLIFRVLAADRQRAEQFLRQLKEEFKRELEVKDILIISRDANLL